MKTAFLLGAGSSVPAGFPSTECITNRIIAGDEVRRHTDGTFYIDRSSRDHWFDEHAQRTNKAIQMVRRLHAEAERYNAIHTGKTPNYEDIFYLADQALDEESGEAENPAIRTFADELRRDMAGLEIEHPKMSHQEMLRETKNYIVDVLKCCLTEPSPTADHLKIFEAPCKVGAVVSIATLCHDVHVERHLKRKGISLADGFSETAGGVRSWTGDFSSPTAIPFLKLHGSVNWFRLRPESSESWFDDKFGTIDGDQDHVLGLDAIDGRPLLLVGTFNKPSLYGRGLFGDIHYQFRSSIRDAETMVICGYSFGDKGINGEIIRWYYAKRDRRFVVIHPDPERLIGNARGAIRNKWHRWEQAGSIEFIRKRLESVNMDEFRSCV